MKPVFDAIVFGSATIDVFLVSSEFKLVKKKGSSFFNLPFDAKTNVEKMILCTGGGGTNVAVGLSRLGLKTAVIARMGKDRFAPMILEELREEGVATRLLAVEAGEETDYATVLIGSQGERAHLVYRGKTRLEEENIAWNQLSASWFHIGSLEGNLSLVRKIIDYGEKESIRISWNPGSRELNQREKILPLIDRVKVLIVNQAEAEMLLATDFNKKEFWQKAFSLKTPLLVITQGREGCWLVFPQERRKIHLPIIGAPRVEATGAGDSFSSGLIAGLFYNLAPEKAARWGAANAASVVGGYGAKAGLLTKRSIKKWLKRK